MYLPASWAGCIFENEKKMSKQRRLGEKKALKSVAIHKMNSFKRRKNLYFFFQKNANLTQYLFLLSQQNEQS